MKVFSPRSNDFEAFFTTGAPGFNSEFFTTGALFLIVSSNMQLTFFWKETPPEMVFVCFFSENLFNGKNQ